MVIRKAQEKDIERIYQLLEQVLRVHANGRPDVFKGKGSKYSREQIKDIIACEKTPVFVADDNGTIKGYAFLEIEDRAETGALNAIKSLYVDDICVDESARGQGIGTLLYEKAKELAKEKNCYNLTLNVWDFNKNALKFYEKLGLTPLKTMMEQIID